MPKDKIPMPIPAKHPLRFAIGTGEPVLEKVAEMKVFINGLDLHPGLKSYIFDELDKQEKNGVSLCLHDVEHAPGDFDL
ncbi:MAG TPA: hypothetical protein VN516_05000, partial [Candidatus Baltobacteraceae bacterium]|nr:hypothetical protein [Candidatus Baltobacteraceae bacterium]